MAPSRSKHHAFTLRLEQPQVTWQVYGTRPLTLRFQATFLQPNARMTVAVQRPAGRLSVQHERLTLTPHWQHWVFQRDIPRLLLAAEQQGRPLPALHQLLAPWVPGVTAFSAEHQAREAYSPWGRFPYPAVVHVEGRGWRPTAWYCLGERPSQLGALPHRGKVAVAMRTLSLQFWMQRAERVGRERVLQEVRLHEPDPQVARRVVEQLTPPPAVASPDEGSTTSPLPVLRPHAETYRLPVFSMLVEVRDVKLWLLPHPGGLLYEEAEPGSVRVFWRQNAVHEQRGFAQPLIRSSLKLDGSIRRLLDDPGVQAGPFGRQLLAALEPYLSRS